ncbi:MAG: hypothetical protein OEY89_02885, partial [Gammaproteobacteria bacterium]|nr:hypothetical protein [Gammaproteobacteria bacterium]
MSTLYQIQNRYKLTNILIAGIALTIAIFWAIEFYYSLHTVSQQQQQYIAGHQEQLTDAKAAEFRILFHEIYQSARTISLLPMVRDLKGDNRTSEDENVVSEGRLSVDAHRTLQQL